MNPFAFPCSVGTGFCSQREVTDSVFGGLPCTWLSFLSAVVKGPHCKGESRGAFTLVELLIVMGIILALVVVALPAINALKGSGDLTAAAYEMAGTLEEARTYAMANNTFVWVGITEVDGVQSSLANPQASGTGSVAMAVLASRDGTRGYDANAVNLSNPVWSNGGGNLIAIGKLQRFAGVHLAPSFSTLPNAGGLTRPTVSSRYFQIGHPSCESITPFQWPLGRGQYSFTKVINFDPQGVARIQYATNADSIDLYMEIGLQQARGNRVAPGPNCVAIQIDAMNGSTHVYRP